MDDEPHFKFAGVELTLSERAESVLEMIRDEEAEELYTDACDHDVALPYEGEYVCGYCHTDVVLEDCGYVWVNLNNGIVKIELSCSTTLRELFG